MFENKYIPLDIAISILGDNKETLGDNYDSVMDKILSNVTYPQVQALSGEESVELFEQMYQTLSDAREELIKAENEVNKMGETPEENKPNTSAEDKTQIKEEAKKTAKAEAEKTTKAILDEEKKKVEDAQIKKRDELEKAKKEAEMKTQLEAKEAELNTISDRLKTLENERLAEKQQIHDTKVRSVVDKMVDIGAISKEEVEAKFDSLKQLEDGALSELDSVIDKRLITEPAKRTVPPSDSNTEKVLEEKQDNEPSNPLDAAFEKLQKLRQTNPSDPFFRGA